jgi:hypothetical protein
MFSNLTRWWQQRTISAARRALPPSARPCLEALEDRIAPAIFVTVFNTDSATSPFTLRGAISQAARSSSPRTSTSRP